MLRLLLAFISVVVKSDDSPTQITTVDVCTACDKNRDSRGVSNECLGGNIMTWVQQDNNNEIFIQAAVSGKLRCNEPPPTKGSEVTIECKEDILNLFNCTDDSNPTLVPSMDSIVAETSTITDFSNNDDSPTQITTVDVCTACDKNRDSRGVSNECFRGNVMTWAKQDNNNEIFIQAAVSGKLRCNGPTKGSEVTIECKEDILNLFNCTDDSNPILVPPTDFLKPYEAFCTSKSAFKDETNIITCIGTDSKACEEAGGSYTSNDDDTIGSCDDIDIKTSTACNTIGFNYERTTCEQFGEYVNYFPSAAIYQDCSIFLVTQFFIPLVQATCCGGESYNKDICQDQSKPHELFCSSESDFKHDATFLSSCTGTDSKACEEAGGSYMFDFDIGGSCDNIDIDTAIACNAIGFTYERTTCAQFGGYMIDPETASIYQDCSNPSVTQNFLPSYQSTCCGGESNKKDICPGTLSNITNADICRVCDKNRDLPGVSEECFGNVTAWAGQFDNSLARLESCDEPNNGSDVSIECKEDVLTFFNCTSHPSKAYRKTSNSICNPDQTIFFSSNTRLRECEKMCSNNRDCAAFQVQIKERNCFLFEEMVETISYKKIFKGYRCYRRK